ACGPGWRGYAVEFTVCGFERRGDGEVGGVFCGGGRVAQRVYVFGPDGEFAELEREVGRGGLGEGAAADGERGAGGVAGGEFGRRGADDRTDDRGAGGVVVLLQRVAAIGGRDGRAAVRGGEGYGMRSERGEAAGDGRASGGGGAVRGGDSGWGDRRGSRDAGGGTD